MPKSSSHFSLHAKMMDQKSAWKPSVDKTHFFKITAGSSMAAKTRKRLARGKNNSHEVFCQNEQIYDDKVSPFTRTHQLSYFVPSCNSFDTK